MENSKLSLGPGRQWRYETIFNDYVPRDIMLDIFPRLPCESVLECRRVCKTWRNLLRPVVDYNHSNYNYFIDRHLHYFHRELQLLKQPLDYDNHYEDDAYDCLANDTGEISLVFTGNSIEKDNRSSLYYVEYDDKSCKKLIRTFNISLPSETPLITVGSCNGLVCLTTKISKNICGRVYICNPITRECVELPRLFENNNEYWDAGIRILFYGFGYVPSTSEYKVVRIIYKLNSDRALCEGQVQIYTLGDHLNRWRDKRDILSPRRVYKSHGLHVNGALHWDVFPGDRMMSFDLLDEDFHFIEYPPKTLPSDWGSFVLANLGGQLCVFCSRKPSISCAEVWVLNKKNKLTDISEAKKVQEGNSSWTRKLTVSMNWEIMHRPFAIFKNGQILLWCKEKNVVAHDLKNLTTTELGDLGMARPEEDSAKPWEWRNYDKAVAHSNSFVSLRRLGEKTSTILDMIT